MGKYLIPIILFLSFNTYAKDIHVMVIDTGIDGSNIQLLKYVQAGTYDDLHDDMGHGTHVAGIIAESGCPNLKIVSCKAFFHGHANGVKVIECLQKALTSNIDVINYSGGGEEPLGGEYDVIKSLSDKGIKINVAAGNNNRDLGSPCYGYFPACFNNIENLTAVGSMKDNQGHNYRSSFSNYGIPITHWEYGEDVLSTLPDNKYGRMTGTSMAAAMFTKHMVQEMCYK